MADGDHAPFSGVGTTDGYAKIDRLDSTAVIQRLRVSVEDAASPPRAPRISAYAPA